MLNQNLKPYFLIGIYFCLFSCSGNNQTKDETSAGAKSYPHYIDIGEGLRNTAVFKLSHIADSIRYIVLSKDKDVLLGRFPDLEMTDSEIYINHNWEFYRFDTSGRFLNYIGRAGHGPTEHFGGSVFTVSPSSDRVYVRRNGLDDYIYYNRKGEYSGEISLPEASNLAEFICLSDSVFISTYLFMGRWTSDENKLFALMDTSGFIEVIEHPAHNPPVGIDLSRMASAPPLYTFYRDQVVLSYLDTIYKINSHSIAKGFIYSWGNTQHMETYEELYAVPTKKDKLRPFGKFFEISGKAYFTIYNADYAYLFEYDKTTGKTKSMRFSGSGDIGFINDLDGGGYYRPEWTNRAGNIWIAYDNAINFIDNNNEEMLSRSEVVDPENKEDLKAFIKTLSEDDNPVLKIVYLKE